MSRNQNPHPSQKIEYQGSDCDSYGMCETGVPPNWLRSGLLATVPKLLSISGPPSPCYVDRYRRLEASSQVHDSGSFPSTSDIFLSCWC